MTTTQVIFTTYGPVRGCCGHKHESRQEADRCLQNDQEGCRSQRGYSDRSVVLVGSDGYLYHDVGQIEAEDGDHWIRAEGGCGGVRM